MFGDYMNKLEAGEKLKKYEDKLSRGTEKIKIQNEIKRQKVREQQKNVPDIDELRKREEENSMGVWERYIVKTTEVEKTKAKILKADVAIRKAKHAESQEKNMVIKANILSNRKER
jgi:hypothetical protein